MRQYVLRRLLHSALTLFGVSLVVFGLLRVLPGDFGQSFQFRTAATDVVAERISATIHLSLAALILTVVFGVPLGILAAARHRSALDYGGMFLAALGQSLPSF